MNKILKSALFAVLLTMIISPSESRASVGVKVRLGPPARRVTLVKPVKPFPGAVWVHGYWTFTGKRYVWSKGYWTKPRHGFVYRQPRWKKSGNVWYYHPGRWLKVVR
jgi:hypothetical protein